MNINTVNMQLTRSRCGGRCCGRCGGRCGGRCMCCLILFLCRRRFAIIKLFLVSADFDFFESLRDLNLMKI